MKKIIVLGLLFVSVPVFAMGKNPLIGVRAQLAEQMKLSDTLNSRISAVETANLKLADKLEAQNTAIAGFNNTVSKVSSEVKAGRDVNTSTSNVNDTDLMWKIIYGLLSVIGVLIGNLFFVVKWLLKEQSNARFYQVSVAKISQNGEFDKMMKDKKEYDNSKKITTKIKGIFNKGGQNVA